MPRTEVIAVHGWGYSSAAWDSWIPLFHGKADFRTFDRGYFGRSHPVQWGVGQPHGGMSDLWQKGDAPPQNRILLLHSMAPLLLSHELIAEATAVVIFGGFRHFHPDATDPSADHSREFLAKMRQALKRDPCGVIESFRRRCELPSRGGAIGEARKEFPGWEDRPTARSGTIAISEAHLNSDLLAEDLDRLESEEIDFEALQRVPQTLILHGTGDRIVPHAKGEELAQALGDSTTFISIDQAGHSLPFTDAEKVMNLIAPHIMPFRSL